MTESHDLAAQYPEKLQELINLWFYEAGKHNGFPLEDRDTARDHHCPHARR